MLMKRLDGPGNEDEALQTLESVFYEILFTWYFGWHLHTTIMPSLESDYGSYDTPHRYCSTAVAL